MKHNSLLLRIQYHPVILLVYRNLVASVDKVFLIWQVVFPLVYIFVAGYSYSALIGEHGIKFGSALISYPAYLSAGMIAFNVMNSSTVAGSIIWNDKRNGMFQQLLVMPFTRMEYILGNLITIILMGLASALLVFAAGFPTLVADAKITLTSMGYTIYALISGAIFFGSVVTIISTRLRTNENFNVIINGIFLFFAFASSAFYPSHGIPSILHAAFYVNPLTYIVDVTRAGLFNQINLFTNVEAAVIGGISALAYIAAASSMARMKL